MAHVPSPAFRQDSLTDTWPIGEMLEQDRAVFRRCATEGSPSAFNFSIHDTTTSGSSQEFTCILDWPFHTC
jgi:hypothetical protein